MMNEVSEGQARAAAACLVVVRMGYCRLREAWEGGVKGCAVAYTAAQGIEKEAACSPSCCQDEEN